MISSFKCIFESDAGIQVSQHLHGDLTIQSMCQYFDMIMVCYSYHYLDFLGLHYCKFVTVRVQFRHSKNLLVTISDAIVLLEIFTCTEKTLLKCSLFNLSCWYTMVLVICYPNLQKIRYNYNPMHGYTKVDHVKFNKNLLLVCRG